MDLARLILLDVHRPTPQFTKFLEKTFSVQFTKHLEKAFSVQFTKLLEKLPKKQVKYIRTVYLRTYVGDVQELLCRLEYDQADCTILLYTMCTRSSYQIWGRTPYPWSPRLRGIIQLSRIGNVLRNIWLTLESLQIGIWPSRFQHSLVPLAPFGRAFYQSMSSLSVGCLNRVKPEETLVEARSDSDVQIDRQIWV